MIYITIGFFIAVFTYIDAIIKDRKFSQYSSLIILFVMLLLVSLRYEVGTDWDAYYNFYRDTTTTQNVEIGYAFLNNLFSNLALPYNFFLFVINGISLSLMFFFLKRNAIVLSIGLLIFFSDLFLYYNLSGIRQAIALSITCCSINYAIERKFILFFACVLLAACFHSTALAFLVVYFLPREKLKIRTVILFFFGFLLCNFFLQSISQLITLYTLKNADYYTSQQEQADNILSLFYVGIIKRSIIVVVILTFGRKLFDLSNSYYFFNLYLFGFAVYISSYLISPDIGARLSSYFTIFEIVLAGNLIYSVCGIKNRVVIASIFSIMAFYKLLAYMSFETYIYDTIINVL